MAKPCPHCGKMSEYRYVDRFTTDSRTASTGSLPSGRSGVSLESWGLAFDLPKRPVPGLPLRVRATVPALRPDEV